MGLDVLGDTNSPVMPIMIYHPVMMAVFSHRCLQRHVATVVVAFPATPLALARTRICISRTRTHAAMTSTTRSRYGAIAA